MPRIPREVVDAVRDRTDLVELVSRHVSLARRGRSHVGLCPFHQEKSPSFHVIPDKGIYHCFGCQAGGDAFKFLMTIEGLSFVEAVKELAGAAGVEIAERELTDAERRSLKQRATLFDVLEAAASYYESVLWTRPEGAPGREYLKGRELTEETQRNARLGYAPEGWTRLVDHLHHQGFSPSLVEQAGLAKPRRQGDGKYDVMRERVIIPITDERGRVIAVGSTSARTLESYARFAREHPDDPMTDQIHTDILLAPGSRWHWVEGMITNFHLPRSTLLAMLASLLETDGRGDGLERTHAIYTHAIEHEYRFYSYGDAMLVLP